MKRLCIFAIVSLLFVWITSCGTNATSSGSSGSNSDPANSGTNSPAVSEPLMVSETPSAETPAIETPLVTEGPLPPFGEQDVVPAEFQTCTQEIHRLDGYVFSCDFAISPWIKYDDTELLDATWAQISDGNFPNMVDSQREYNIEIGVNANNIAYAVGYFQINNITPDFDITASIPINLPIGIYATHPNTIIAIAWSNNVTKYKNTCMNELMNLSTGDTAYYMFTNGGNAPNINMPMMHLTSNKTGKICFVIALRINDITPNNPTGDINPADVSIGLFKTSNGELDFPIDVYQNFTMPITW